MCPSRRIYPGGRSVSRDGEWDKKEKGRLLAPSLQSGKVTAAVRSLAWASEASRDKSREFSLVVVSALRQTAHLVMGKPRVPRQIVRLSCNSWNLPMAGLTGARLATTGPDLRARRDAAQFRNFVSRSVHPCPELRRQAFACRAARARMIWTVVTPPL